MAIAPNSIDPATVKKLILEGLDFRPDGGMSVGRVQTNDNPAVAEREMQIVQDTAVAWRKVHDFTANLSDEDYERRKTEAAKLRDKLFAISTKSDAPRPASTQFCNVPLRPLSMRECWVAYMATKKRIALPTKNAYDASFGIFVAMMGGEDRLAHEIAEVEFMEFNDALAHVPLHAKKRGLELKRAAEMNASPPQRIGKDGNAVEVEVIGGETANLHCTNLQGFFDYIISSGRRNGDNPFLKLKRHSDGASVSGADGFDEHELKAIFNLDTFMQEKRPSQFWGPLLALYTGARLNELACLELTNFVKERDIPCISIRYVPRAKPGTIEHKTRTARQIKTAASTHLAPLHSDLFEIGLESRIEDLRSFGATRFFPTLPEAKKTKKREWRLSHDGNEYLKKAGGHTMRNKVMHSFRDTVCEMLSVPDMVDVRTDQWTGHTNQTVKGRHYRRSKAAIELQAKEGFGALRFPFLDLEAIQYRPRWFNDYNQKNMVD